MKQASNALKREVNTHLSPVSPEDDSGCCSHDPKEGRVDWTELFCHGVDRRGTKKPTKLVRNKPDNFRGRGGAIQIIKGIQWFQKVSVVLYTFQNVKRHHVGPRAIVKNQLVPQQALQSAECQRALWPLWEQPKDFVFLTCVIQTDAGPDERLRGEKVSVNGCVTCSRNTCWMTKSVFRWHKTPYFLLPLPDSWLFTILDISRCVSSLDFFMHLPRAEYNKLCLDRSVDVDLMHAAPHIIGDIAACTSCIHSACTHMKKCAAHACSWRYIYCNGLKQLKDFHRALIAMHEGKEKGTRIPDTLRQIYTLHDTLWA